MLLPCQKMKFLDSAWHADMGGWWLTLRMKTEKPWDPHTNTCSQMQSIQTVAYLFGHKTKAFVWSVTLVGLAQHWIKGFSSCSVVTGSIAWHCKCCDVHLHTKHRRLHLWVNVACLANDTRHLNFYCFWYTFEWLSSPKHFKRMKWHWQVIISWQNI